MNGVSSQSSWIVVSDSGTAENEAGATGTVRTVTGCDRRPSPPTFTPLTA